MRLSYFARLPLLLASVACSLCAAATQAQHDDWPSPPSRLDLTTPYGRLHVQTNEYVYESRLLVDGTDVTPKIEGILNITYAFNLPDAQAALISIAGGDTGCPIAYRWIMLNKKGYKVSPAFGSCSEQIKVSAVGRRFIVKTPAPQKPDKMDVYIYDGETIKQRTKR